MIENKYTRATIEGDKKTKWICGCFQTADDYFKFCETHNGTLKKVISFNFYFSYNNSLRNSSFTINSVTNSFIFS